MTKKLEELFDIASSDENELNEPIPGVAKEVTKAINIPIDILKYFIRLFYW